jgi:hypothetical protein
MVSVAMAPAASQALASSVYTTPAAGGTFQEHVKDDDVSLHFRLPLM